MNYDAIIFDVDGTLWYSCDRVAVCWSELATGILGRPIHWTAEDMEREFGKTMDAILDSLLPDITPTQRKEVAESWLVAEVECLRETPGVLYPGVKATLEQLAKKYRLFIVSNCQKGYIETMLDPYGLRPLFEDWMCWEDTYKEKQDTILALMARHGLEHPVYVGDTQGDANACGAAGVDMIFASYGLGKVESPMAAIRSISELPGLLETL